MIAHEPHTSRCVLLFITFFHWVSFGLVYPLFSCMLFDADCSLLPLETSSMVRGIALGILLAASPIVQFFSAPILGASSDTKGRKKTLMVAFFIETVGYFIAVVGIFFSSLFVLVLSRIVIGISLGSIAIISAALADLSIDNEKDKTRNFGLYNMINGLALTVGSLLGGILSQRELLNKYAVPFFVANSVTLVNLFLIVYAFKETRVLQRQKHFSIARGFLLMKKALAVDQLRGILIAACMFCLGWSIYWEFIPAMMASAYHVHVSVVSNLYAYAAICYAISCAVLIRPVIYVVRTRAMFFYALVCCALTMVIFLYYMNPRSVWIYVPIQQFLLALIFPAMATLASNCAGRYGQGEALGALESAKCLAFALGPLLAGFFLGIDVAMPILMGICLLIGAAVALVITFTKKDVLL